MKTVLAVTQLKLEVKQVSNSHGFCKTLFLQPFSLVNKFVIKCNYEKRNISVRTIIKHGISCHIITRHCRNYPDWKNEHKELIMTRGTIPLTCGH